MKPFRLTEEDFLDAQALHRGWWSAVILVLCWAAITGYFSWLAVESGRQRDVVAALAMSVFCAVVFVFAVWLRHRRLLRAFREQRSLHRVVTVSFDADSVSWEQADGHFRGSWRDMRKLREGRGLLLIYEARHLMRIVPLRAFEDDIERDAFLLAARRIGRA